MKYRRILPVILAAVLLVGAAAEPVRAASSDQIRQEINGLKEQNRGIQAELNAIQGQYDANASDIQELVDQKNGLDQEISLMNEQIENLNQQIANYGQLIADIQEQLEQAQDHLDALNQKHKERIRAMEEGGKVTYWSVIFEANSFTDLLDRLNMVSEINASDQRRLQELQQAAENVEVQRITMDEERRAMEDSKTQLEATQATLELKREQSDEVLRQLLEKEAEIAVLLDEANDKINALMDEISQKEKEYESAKYDEYLAKLAAAGDAPPSDAKWVRPLSNLRVTSPFGTRVHPITGKTRTHNGIDFGAPSGTPIYATRAGTVTTAAYQAGGAGYYVRINHGDGFGSIYMHMTNFIVKTGQTVSQGQVIGYVGSTGLSTGPHLHFGVSYAGKYVNPMAYIY